MASDGHGPGAPEHGDRRLRRQLSARPVGGGARRPARRCPMRGLPYGSGEREDRSRLSGADGRGRRLAPRPRAGVPIRRRARPPDRARATPS